MGLLYKLTFSSGKSYIGVTSKSMATRLRSHKAIIAIGRPSVLYNAWRKYGDPVVEILGEFSGKALYAAEIEAIARLGTLHPGGYNSTPGGEESPMLIPEIAAKLLGIKRSEETKAKLSASKKGTMTSEHRALLKAKHANNTYRLGKPHSEETKQKIRASLLARSKQ